MSQISSTAAVSSAAASDREQRGPLGLGLFMPNCSNAYSITTYKPVPDDWTYESNAQIARAAEAAGFDFLFPVAKWKGYGGKTDFLGTSLETMTWAGALLAITERIQVFSTVHVPIFHPSSRPRWVRRSTTSEKGAGASTWSADGASASSG